MPEIGDNSAILDRIKELKGWSGHGSDKKLAEFLGKTSSVISGWRHRNTMDLGILRERLSPEEFVYATTGRKPLPKDKPLPAQDGLPKEITDAIQIAVQMVEDYVQAMPEAMRKLVSPQLKGAWVAVAANGLASGKQELIPKLMTDMLRELTARAAEVQQAAQKH